MIRNRIQVSISMGHSEVSAGDLVIARLTMHHGTVLGDANEKPIPKKLAPYASSTSLFPSF